MLPALTLDDVLERARATGRNASRERLVSVVFADAASPVWPDVQTNRVQLNLRSGQRWDLFFAGMARWGPLPEGGVDLGVPGNPQRLGPAGGRRHFSPRHFHEFVEAVEEAHAAATHTVPKGLSGPWRYSGGTDLVFFTTHNGAPDWLTLEAVTIYEPGSPQPSLGQITERLRYWQDDEPLSLASLVSDQLVSDDALVLRPADVLGIALRWGAQAALGGVVGNAAYDLLSRAFQ